MQNVVILGASGSIGQNTLDVISRHPERFTVLALSAHSRMDVLAQQVQAFVPRYAVVPTAQRKEQLLSLLGVTQTQVLVGEQALSDVASHPDADTVMCAIVGAAGLPSALAAARSGKRVLLANKEALVVGGELFVRTARENGAQVLPIDSEHNAIFQCLPKNAQGDFSLDGVQSIVLTASGGPFRRMSANQLHTVTPDQAVAHPNWVMGRKISVDSASLMNKGLELIEAYWLFGVAIEQISVVVHPQSTVHSMVTYTDGSVLAQLGAPDMRTPIAYGLAYPQRIESGSPSLNLAAMQSLEFESPDFERFPCLGLAFDALRSGHAACVALNAANEIAVQAFLERKIRFTELADVISHTLQASPSLASSALTDLSAILALDQQARALATQRVGELA